MIKIIHEWLIEVDFPYDEILQGNKEGLIKHYTTSQMRDGIQYADLPINDLNFINFFSPKIKNIIEDAFYIEKKSKWDISFNYIIQNKEKQISLWHNHISVPACVTGTFYTDLPKNGGELEMFHPPTFPIDNPFRFKPQINKLYLFPSWIYHRPLPQKDEKDRICINVAYYSSFRPILKEWGFKW